MKLTSDDWMIIERLRRGHRLTSLLKGSFKWREKPDRDYVRLHVVDRLLACGYVTIEDIDQYTQSLTLTPLGWSARRER